LFGQQALLGSTVPAGQAAEPPAVETKAGRPVTSVVGASGAAVWITVKPFDCRFAV